jgi:hypothetical protein
LYFLITNDWSARLGKLAFLDPLLRVLTHLQLGGAGTNFNMNIVGGVLAVLLPLQIAAVMGFCPRFKWLGGLLIALTAFGLLVSELRGAWIALIGVGLIWALWSFGRRLARRRGITAKSQAAVFVGASSLLIFFSLGILVLTPLGNTLLTLRSDRWNVWQNSLDLVSDYPFTGLGLGGFSMAYSSYTVLVHVEHTLHAHNLFLDIWLQQGLLGLLSLIGLVAVTTVPALVALIRDDSISRWQMAALVSLGVLVTHGMVDDSLYGYSAKAIPFLFVPFCVLSREQPFIVVRLRSVLGIVGVVAVALIGVAILPTVRATFEANLGALAQTRAELSVYRWPQWSIQDELRRSGKIDLSSAIAQYKTALALDPANATANRRLGQIEISLGHYADAREHLEKALAASSNQRATRAMLGETYAIAGEIDRAAMLWRGVDVSDGQLDIRAWWYDHIGEKEYAARVRQAAQINQPFR